MPNLLRRLFPLVAPLALCLALTSCFPHPWAKQERPRLILLLVIDQFRADYLTRFEQRLGPGGFKRLISRGAYYPFGQYDLLENMTCPGHATISTGAYPYLMGIGTNEWFDPATGQETYCVEDSSQRLVGVDQTPPHAGTSPRNLIGDTLGDELRNAGYPSRVISVALKDRAAILMGGHRADLALWLDWDSFRWVSSTHYLPDGQLPAWVTTLNGAVAQELSEPRADAVEWKSVGRGTGFTQPSSENAFDYHYRPGSEGSLASPYGLALTTEAAEAALKNYSLGTHDSPDLLAVSFSSHDLVGHAFGPNRRELEEMTVAEDHEIATLLDAVEKQVPGGLDSVAVALTGDHGVAPDPDYLRANHHPGGRIEESTLRAAVEDELTHLLGKAGPGGWVRNQEDLQLYLDRAAIAKKGRTLEAVEAAAQARLERMDGVLRVLTSTDIEQGRLPTGLLRRQAEHSYVPGRSGDLVIVPRPFTIVGAARGTTHQTGFSYDRTVPLLFSGPAFRPGVYSQRAEVVDLAPTLAFIARVLPPALSEGRVLTEALAGKGRR